MCSALPRSYVASWSSDRNQAVPRDHRLCVDEPAHGHLRLARHSILGDRSTCTLGCRVHGVRSWSVGTQSMGHSWQPSSSIILAFASGALYMRNHLRRSDCSSQPRKYGRCKAGAIRLTDFEPAKKELRHRRSRFAISTGLWVTGCTLVMFISVLIWGISLAQNFPDLVHQRLGPLNGFARFFLDHQPAPLCTCKRGLHWCKSKHPDGGMAVPG